MNKDAEEWIRRVHESISRKDINSDTEFHTLMQSTPNTKEEIIADTIFSAFLDPFDYSAMQASITALGSWPIESYVRSYIRILPRLLKEQPDWATDLLDYPGRELTKMDMKFFKKEILSSPDGKKTLTTLKEAIYRQNLEQDEPWNLI